MKRLGFLLFVVLAYIPANFAIYGISELPWVRKHSFFVLIILGFLCLAWGIWRNRLRRKKQSVPRHES